MNKNSILIVILLILGSITAWYFMTQDASTTLDTGETMFAIEDVDEIGKVFIANLTGKSATLTRNGGSWLYNNKYKARPQSVDNLLKTLKEVKVRHVVSNAALNNVMAELRATGITVEIFDKKDKLMKSYIVGGASADDRGTHMIMNGSSTPYVTHIKLWEGVLTPRYMIAEGDWRDRTVFEEKPEDIDFVSIEYPKQQRFSFKLERQSGKDFKIEPFYPTQDKIDMPLIPGKVQQFLIGFDKCVAEAFENTNPARQDVLTQQTPFTVITVRKKSGNVKTVKLYPIDETFDGSNPLDVTIERYFLHVKDNNRDDFMLGQQRVFKDVLWGYDPQFFFNDAK